jgi:hypothetical protein
LAFELINHEQFQIAQEHLLLLLKPEQSPYQIIQRDKGKQTSTFQASGQSQTFQFTISPKQLALSSLPADHRFFLPRFCLNIFCNNKLVFINHKAQSFAKPVHPDIVLA